MSAVLARRAGVDLEGAPAEEVIAWASQTFGNALCVTTSMTDGVLVHLASRVVPGIDVLFVDTGYHFVETLGTRDAVSTHYDVRLVTVSPRLNVAQQDLRFGPRLYERDPDRCCAMRKVAPLTEALAPYDAWVTGLRRDEAPTRSAAPVVDWDERRGKVKINPLAAWTAADVADYADRHGVLRNPLVDAGYRSIGCAPCTRPVGPDEAERAGRWAGRGKSECGLHA